MLEIKPCVDKHIIAPYCKRCAVLYTEALYLYRALDRDEVLAAGLFLVGGQNVDILHYEAQEPDDHFLFDAVLRAGLNYAAEQGIPDGHIPESFREKHAAQFDKLNFPHESSFNITNFFQKYKHCAR